MSILVYRSEVSTTELGRLDLEEEFLSKFDPADFDIPTDANHAILGHFEIEVKWTAGVDDAA